MSRAIAALLVFSAFNFAGCASAPKPGSPPKLAEYEGKKVALVEVDGEESARKIAEVALVNQLIQRGTFILIPKNEVDQARQAIGIDATDWRGIAKKSGADVALRARILRFDADTREGYSSEEVYDSQLAKERGKEGGNTSRLYKVKAMKSTVEVELEFADARSNTPDSLRKGVALHEKEVSAEAKSSAIHLPPKLRFLEETANEAFRKFFEQYE